MQTTSHILMIRPARFAFNEQTAQSNAFQHTQAATITGISPAIVQEKALIEFDAMVEGLRNLGVNVTVVEDTPEPHTPDAIFPNNWVSFHEDGTVCLYPMQAPNRRLERREDIVANMQKKFDITCTQDFSGYESAGQFLEGTGSMVLDRVNRIVYACLSPRTSVEILEEFSKQMDYRIISFTATDEHGKQIYHTNVIMSIGNRFAVICLESITDKEEKAKVLMALNKSGKDVIDISMEQLKRFAGNMLQIENKYGEPILVMSSQAYRSLLPGQLKKLEKYNQMFYTDLQTIESNGGGSARCMMAEVHLPVK